MNRKEFAERYGDPSKFVFNGQFYDAGLSSKAKCTVCGQVIHHVYVLRNDRDRSAPISSCCFAYFKDNTKLYVQLQAAQVLLGVTVAAEERHLKIFGPRLEVRERRESWRRIKRQALDVIREFRKKTGKEWLPEELFDLKVVAEQQPAQFKRATNAVRWYDRQTQTLEQKISLVKLP